MSNKYAAWYLRVRVNDLEQLPFRPAEDNEAGEGLPADFPRDEFTDDQLVLLDEYYHAKREEVVKQFFRLFRVRPGSMDLTLWHIALNAGILVKMLGIGDPRSFTWGELCDRLGVSEDVMYRHKKEILRLINEIKK